MKDLCSKGRPFPVVMQDFLEWCGDDVVFCSWGPQDLTELQRNMHYHKMKPLADGPIPFYNVQKLYSMFMNEEGTTRNLEYAVDSLKIEKDVAFHRAYSDSYYTAKILRKIDKKYINNTFSYDIYHLPKSSKEEIFVLQGKNAYFLSKAYEDRAELVDNRKIFAMNCVLCGKKPVRPKIRWFMTGTKYYCGAAICNIHGPIKAKLKIKKNDSNLYYAEKYLDYCKIEDFEEIRNKKKSIKKESPKE